MARYGIFVNEINKMRKRMAGLLVLLGLIFGYTADEVTRTEYCDEYMAGVAAEYSDYDLAEVRPGSDGFAFVRVSKDHKRVHVDLLITNPNEQPPADFKGHLSGTCSLDTGGSARHFIIEQDAAPEVDPRPI
jgi:hypothetical protein